MSINGISTTFSRSAQMTPWRGYTEINEDGQKLTNTKMAEAYKKARADSDTVTISDESRLRLGEGTGDGESAKIGAFYRSNPLTKEDVTGFKESVAALSENKTKISSNIKKLLSKNSIKIGGDESLKIEVHASGKAVVGGVKDAKTARKIEKLINGDSNLLDSIKEYQKEEKKVSKDLKAVTGTSFEDLKRDISKIEKGNVFSLKDRGVAYTKEELLNFEDYNLHQTDPELMKSIKDFIMPDNSGIEFSGGNHIISQPEAVMKNTVRDIASKIKEQFDGMNRALQDQYKIRNDEDAKELQDKMLSLDKIKIQIDGGGNVIVEGKAAEDAERDRMGRAFIEYFVKDQLQDNQVLGTKNDFKVAADYLLMYYDEQSGGDDKNERKMVTTFERGTIETHVSSPKKESELKNKISEDISEMMQDSGVKLTEPLEIDIDNSGKISVKNMPEDKMQRQMLDMVLKQINSLDKTSNSGISPKENATSTMKPIERIKENINKLMVYQRDGARHIMTNAKNFDSLEKDENQKLSA